MALRLTTDCRGEPRSERDTFTGRPAEERYQSHNGRNNFAFVDGHVKSLPTLDPRRITPSADDDQ